MIPSARSTLFSPVVELLPVWLLGDSKANPDLKILLVEGGPNNFQNPMVVNPAVFLSHLAPDSKTALVSFYPRVSDGNPHIFLPVLQI
jgi:hypothetical protein